MGHSVHPRWRLLLPLQLGAACLVSVPPPGAHALATLGSADFGQVTTGWPQTVSLCLTTKSRQGAFLLLTGAPHALLLVYLETWEVYQGPPALSVLM
jgi:hypothetical protein